MDALDQAGVQLQLDNLEEDEHENVDVSEAVIENTHPPPVPLTSEAATLQLVEDNVDSSSSPPSGHQSPQHDMPSESTPFQRQKEFTESPGPTQPLEADATPFDAFLQVFGERTFDSIAEQTNVYAQQNPPPTGYRWYPTTAAEIMLFIGMVICMGIIRLPATVDYWSTNPLLSIHTISSCMPVCRFKALLRTIHLNDNTKAKRPGEDGYDKLFKIRPLLDVVLANSNRLYIPHREVSIDEGMVLFKGRSSYKQYMPQKPVKRGFKVWCLAVSRNGYLSNFEVYTGATDGSSEGLGASVVKRLSTSLRSKGYHLYFDNFFSSVDLAQDLLQDELYCIATTRTNRKKWPAALKDIKARNKTMKRGDHTSEVVGGNVQCIVWKDNRCVPFLNTIDEPGSSTTVLRKEKSGRRCEVPCPVPVKLYNQFMGGVDLTDSRRKLYSCSRKSRRWWMRLFYFLVDVSVINAHILTRESPQCCKMPLKEFIMELAKHLMSMHNSKKRKGRISSDGPPSSRFCDRHFSKKVSKPLVCRVCSSERKCVRTSFVCKECNPNNPVHLCPSPCFTIYHTRQTPSIN